MPGATENAATARALFDRGDWAGAEALCRRLLAVDPGDADALCTLGLVAWKAGALEDAARFLRAAVDRRSDPSTWSNLGLVLAAAGRGVEAEAAHREALRLAPDHAVALNNLGNLLGTSGREEEGLACLAAATRVEPKNAVLWHNRGSACHRLGRIGEALDCFGRALQIRPGYVRARINLAVSLRAAGETVRAVEELRRALAEEPGSAEGWNNLGNALAFLDRSDEALAAFERSLSLAPEAPTTLRNCASLLASRDDYARAAALLQASLSAEDGDPQTWMALLHARQYLCAWEGYDELASRIRDGVAAGAAVAPFLFLTLDAPPAAQRANAEAWTAEKITPFVPAGPRLRPQRRGGRITVGYLSRDFRQHVVATLIAGLLETHDRSRFRIHGYSFGEAGECAMRTRLQGSLDRFVDLQMLGHAEAAEAIRADGVDLLVDLKGHTTNGRPEIAFRRAAPVQVRWLGHAGTMGGDAFDAILLDPVVAPPGAEAYYSERIVRLPDCYQVNDRARQIAEATPTRAACGLPERGAVFCCFNHTYKISPRVFSVWMEILRAAPGSALWLLESHEAAAQNLRREAEARGVDGRRLVFASRLPQPEHLARYRIADLFLDTSPVCACATASDALWAGCPVLTCPGENFAARAGASIVSAAGLPGLVASSWEEYRERAVALAGRPEELRALRDRLETTRLEIPLFDTNRFARHLEAAFERLVRDAEEAPPCA